MTDAGIQDALLSRLLGVRIYSIEIILNEYLQLRFDGEPDASGAVTLAV